MRIYFATSLRGFFKHIITEKELCATITSEKSAIYELNNRVIRFLKGIVRLPLFDYLGLIRVPAVKSVDGDAYGSFNRFLVADKPYFIYVENPTALFHYCIHRSKTFLGKRNVRGNLCNPQLKALVCMSKACRDTFEKVCGQVPPSCVLTQIYPLVPNNSHVSERLIKDRYSYNGLKLLYIAQGVRFLSKGGLEVIEAFRRLKQSGYAVSLTVVTSFSDADRRGLDLAKETEGITLFDFQFSFDQMQQLYANHHVLLIPTSDDSFNLTVLEAMKAGLPIIGSCLYAIPEMVKDGENGYLCEPAWWFFDKYNLPNPSVWNHRRKTIYSGKRNERIIQFLVEKITIMYNDRELLCHMSMDSWRKATSAPFSKEYIVSQWNQLFSMLGGS